MYFLINGHWESLNNFQDVSRIVGEYYNQELSNELDALIEAQEDEIKRLEQSIDELKDELDYTSGELYESNNENERLKDKIKTLEGLLDEIENSLKLRGGINGL